MENLNTTPLPRIGDKAPSFEAVTTQGPIRFPEDYAGRWIILFSHPSDFTPVCTSEFMTFAARSDEFEALNCQLVGLSVDGLYSHIAWLRTIRDKIVYRGMQHVEVRFPLIADLRMKVANLDSAISEWHYLGSRPAIVDFYATWCGPCRTLAPILEELSEEYAGEVDIYKVDIDCEQELAAAFGVRSVPTLLFIPARGMPQMATGALPKETLREAIGELLLKLPAAES